MNDFRLTVFCSVAQNMSFTKAARELGVTQPAVSHHIQELEQELGVVLFDRLAGGIELTEAGHVLLQHAHKILNSYHQLDFDMRLLNRGHSGELRLGATPTIAQYILPACAASFASKFRQIKLSIIEGNSAEIERLVAEGEVDMGLVENSSRRESLRYTPFMQDELLLVAPVRGRWASLDVVRPAELATMPMVLSSDGTDLYKAVERFFALHEIALSSLDVVMQLNNDEAIKRYIVPADCVAFVSEQAFRRDSCAAEYKVIEIAGGPLVRQCSFVRNIATTKDVVKGFIDYMQEWLTQGE